MPMLSSVLGFSGFGLLVRLWQLGIQRRNIADNLSAHPAYMVGFGFVGYWAERWERYSTELIEQKKEALLRIREKEAAVTAVLKTLREKNED